VTPDLGDILHLAFDPASGREMKGDHYCLVVTPKAFNQHFGLAWTLPITTGAQSAARGVTAVTLMGTGLKVSGNVLCHQIKALDWSARRASKVDRLKGLVLDEILDICTGILDPARRA
jgi:mRNA interferase ChpB